MTSFSDNDDAGESTGERSPPSMDPSPVLFSSPQALLPRDTTTLNKNLGVINTITTNEESPFMSFDDFYQTGGDRQNSSFEEFWEHRGGSSAASAMHGASGQQNDGKHQSMRQQLVARTVRTMTLPELGRIASLTRLSSLSGPRLSSLSKASVEKDDQHLEQPPIVVRTRASTTAKTVSRSFVDRLRWRSRGDRAHSSLPGGIEEEVVHG